MKYLQSYDKYLLAEAIQLGKNQKYTYPLYDSETLVVYHGFNDSSIVYAPIFAKFGMSGQETIARIWSYENTNNPRGLFVSPYLDVAKDFGMVIMEFVAHVKDLDVPAWSTQLSKGFSTNKERIQSQEEFEDHIRSMNNQLQHSDRPALAFSLFYMKESQAIFMGNLDPNMIRAFWVHKETDKFLPANNPENSTLLNNALWTRYTRKQFLNSFYNKNEIENSNEFKKVYRKILLPNQIATKETIETRFYSISKNPKYDIQTFWKIVDKVKKNPNYRYMLDKYLYPNQIDFLLKQS